MLPHTHFMAGLLVGLIGYSYNLINAWQILLIAFLTTAIDIDHLIAYYLHHHSWNPIKCWNKSVDHKEKLRTLLHNLPLSLLITALFIIIAYFNLTLGFILLGIYTTHMLTDYLFQSFIETKRVGFKLGKIVLKIHVLELLVDAILIMALLLFL